MALAGWLLLSKTGPFPGQFICEYVDKGTKNKKACGQPAKIMKNRGKYTCISSMHML